MLRSPFMTSAHEFAVPIHDLDAAGKPFHFPVRARWIRGTLEDTAISSAGGDGALDIRLSKSGNDVIVHGNLTADLTVPCARCLELAIVHVDEPISVLMVPAPAIKGSRGPDDEYEFKDEEADVLPYDGETVVLDDLVRDELLLAVPMNPLCSDSCPGIRPPSAEPSKASEPAVDPRLLPLTKLKIES
jgi:uncharacterized protein